MREKRRCREPPVRPGQGGAGRAAPGTGGSPRATAAAEKKLFPPQEGEARAWRPLGGPGGLRPPPRAAPRGPCGLSRAHEANGLSSRAIEAVGGSPWDRGRNRGADGKRWHVLHGSLFGATHSILGAMFRAGLWSPDPISSTDARPHPHTRPLTSAALSPAAVRMPPPLWPLKSPSSQAAGILCASCFSFLLGSPSPELASLSSPQTSLAPVLASLGQAADTLSGPSPALASHRQT